MRYENQTFAITSEHFEAVIAAKGAELQSLRRRSDNKEFIWQRDPDIWEDCSPMLFPICGRLNNARYLYEGKEYKMDIHGFLPSLYPCDVKLEEGRAIFTFEDNDTTLAQYPFRFRLTVTYTLTGTGIGFGIEIENRDEKRMHYAIGAHPGFATPLREGATLADHFVIFPEAGNVQQAIIDDGGLFTGELPDYPLTDKQITLSESQFEIDGIFLTGTGSTVELHCKGADDFVRVTSNRCDLFGIWKEYGERAKFLCLEPWCGYPSISGKTDVLEEKFGMHSLAPNKKGLFAVSIDVLPEQ